MAAAAQITPQELTRLFVDALCREFEATKLDGMPRYCIARRCRHWGAERNRRYRIYRLDERMFDGRFRGAVWDGDELEWIQEEYGIHSDILGRDATKAEIDSTVRLI